MSIDSSLVPKLLFVTGGLDSRAVIARLEEAATDDAHQHANELFLSGVFIDRPVLRAAVNLLQRRKWLGVHFGQCSGLVHGLIEAACQSGIPKLSLLCEFRRMDTSWCRALGRGLQHGNCKVRKLILQAQLSAELAQALYEGLNTSIHTNDRTSELEELSLPLSEASWQSILLLSASLQNCKSLKKLSLNRHDLLWTMDDSQVITIMKALRNNSSLKELYIQGSSCHQSGMEAISKYILSGSDCFLEKLDLSNHRFGMDRLPGIKALSAAMETKRSLRSLSLSGHQLTPQDVENLASALAHDNCQVRDIYLTNCNLTNDCISVLAPHLAKMKSLRSLWIHDNPFDCHGASQLVEALEHNTNLENLILPPGHDMKGLQAKLDLFLQLNKAGRRLLWSRADVPPCLWAKVLERAGQAPKDKYRSSYTHVAKSRCGVEASAVYHLLHQGPIAFER